MSSRAAETVPRGPLLAGLALVAVLGLGALALAGGGAPGPDRAAASTAGADTVTLVPTTAVTARTDGVAETGGGTAGDRADQVADAVRPDSAAAIFAGGCFWCMEPPYDRLDGVLSTTSGFTGGEIEHPTYEQVAYGRTRHREAVRVVYDPSKISYTNLLQVFWHNVDPTDDGGQFCDRGFQYTTAVFALNEEQERLARASKRRLEKWEGLKGPVATTVTEAGPFYPAEAYHQDFYRTHSAHYERYRKGCRRDERLREIWGEAAPH